MVNSNQPNYPWPVIAGVALLILFLVFGIPGLFFGILIWIKNIICDSFLFFWDFGIEKYQNEQYLLAFISFFFLILVFGSILKLLGVLINYLFGRRSIQNGDVNTERGNIIPSIGSIFGKFELPKLGSNTTFWILLLFAAFTFRYWGGYFGGSIGTGAREAGVNFFNGLTGKIDPKSLEIQRPLKNQNGDYEFNIPPGVKIGPIEMSNTSKVYASTHLYFNPNNNNEVLYYPSFDEYKKTKKGGTIPPGEKYYVFTDAGDTVNVRITK